LIVMFQVTCLMILNNYKNHLAKTTVLLIYIFKSITSLQIQFAAKSLPGVKLKRGAAKYKVGLG